MREGACEADVPGLADLHRMVLLLLAEHAPPEAEILVLGAGDGRLLKAFAEARPDWRLLAVDPSAARLELMRRTLGSLAPRARLLRGGIDDVPEGPFGGAALLFTLHFLDVEERLAALKALKRRLKPGAALVVAHHSCPDGGDLWSWLARSLAFADRDAGDLDRASAAAEAMMARLPILSSEEDEGLLYRAGFSEVTLFYAAFSVRGWVAFA
jgi:tRNA (cmo5U34)-methyltransferase